MKPALLVIDVQKAFFEIDPQTAKSLKDAIEYINAAIALFRNKQLPVIAIQHMDAEDQLTPSADGFALPDELEILDSDLHITKTYSNAFNKTPLLEQLHALGVDTVIITGFCAEFCVLSTCRGAEDMDLEAIILRGSLASLTQEHIAFVEAVNEVISFGALRAVLA